MASARRMNGVIAAHMLPPSINPMTPPFFQLHRGLILVEQASSFGVATRFPYRF
jgi:hypothetical protein